MTIDSIKGHVLMRPCDHQGVQGGYMVQVRKKAGYSFPIPQIIATFPPTRSPPAAAR